MKFSVIDLETTGFAYKSHDRIIEISVINIDESGKVLDTFESLINPLRDVGKSKVHGITPQMVTSAPLFEEIAGHVMDLVSGSVVVAHNAHFDTNFLNQELFRAGLSAHPIKGLCTLELSRDVLPHLSSRKLTVLCEYLDIPLLQAHSAYSDCLATKELFLHLFNKYRSQYGLERFIDSYVTGYHVPQEGKIGNGLRRVQPRKHAISVIKEEEGRLKRMISRLPSNKDETNILVQEYLNLLDEIIADRIITEEEASRLFELSLEYGISREHAELIHMEYLRRLIRVYLWDGSVTDTMMDDLKKVAALIDLTGQLDLLINTEKSALPSFETPVDADHSYVGKTICFTGELSGRIGNLEINRQYAQELALAKGLIVKNGVSRNLDILIVADPYTQSSKAKKARELGVKIIAEAVFWKMLGIKVD